MISRLAASRYSTPMLLAATFSLATKLATFSAKGPREFFSPRAPEEILKCWCACFSISLIGALHPYCYCLRHAVFNRRCRAPSFSPGFNFLLISISAILPAKAPSIRLNDAVYGVAWRSIVLFRNQSKCFTYVYAIFSWRLAAYLDNRHNPRSFAIKFAQLSACVG